MQAVTEEHIAEERASHLLKHNALSVRGACKRLLPLVALMTLLVIFVCPEIFSSMLTKLAPGSQTAGLSAVAAVALQCRRSASQATPQQCDRISTCSLQAK